QLHVDTTDGRVTLYGTVGSESAKADAERIARRVVGVREVRNLITVVAPPLQPAMKDQNKAVEENVILALRGDPGLANTGIRVESADAGVVVLGGTAKSLSELQRAVRIARGVAGVQRVRSVVETPPSLTEKEISGDASAAGAEDNPARDTWLTTAVKAALKDDPSIAAGSIAVDTEDGVVTLFGVVPSDAARRAAERTARSIRGVRSVQNELLVRTDKR
ncbi:MAG: BON domain-containing protein, partial [Candidatus Binatia bacterium]